MPRNNGTVHHPVWYRLVLFMAMLALVFGNQTAQTAQAQVPEKRMLPPTSNVLNLSVVSARTEARAFAGAGVTKGTAITAFKYIINIDNAGTTTQRGPQDGCSPADVGYPGSCHWTSVAGVPGSSPIYTQGTNLDFASGLTLPNGKYLISVLADGYKLDGAHFTIPITGPLTVELQPNPLPTATIRARVFEDNAPTNSGPDEPAERPLAGFVGHIADYIGEVTTDVYGNPLCTQYETDGSGNVILAAPDYSPTPIPGTGGHCVSDVNGDLVIPNLGPNRYTLSAVPPAGQTWIQTTTLEGNHDWDAWVMEGATGLDTEFVVGGEPYPAIFFGFVKPTAALPAGPTGSISGIVAAAKVYVPTNGGLSLPGAIWGGLNGAKLDAPIVNPWISLSDLTNGDQSIYVGQGDANGAFTIANVPDGNYTLTYWDEDQNYILDLQNVTVTNGEAVDMGVLPLTGWWTKIEGHIYNDLNGNGKMDPGEPGLPNFPVTFKKRENSVMDRGGITVSTDQTGYYKFDNAYPITQWLVEEVYSDLYYTTGVTYQADNQLDETTVLGSGVDVSVHPVIGLSGRLDWGVRPYEPGHNGGIVGTVSYDTTRNEFDPRFAAVEAWQPGIPNLNVDLFQPVACNSHPGTACDASGRYELASNGSFAKGKLLNQYLTETWQRPTGCVARDIDGNPLVYPTDQQSLPTDPNAECLEAPLMGVQFQTGFSTVDGNYGFGDGCFGVGGFDVNTQSCADGSQPTALNPADYLVSVEIPDDVTGRPMYKVTKEEDINIYNGDQYVPQIPPSECAGPLHTVDVVGIGTDGYPAVPMAGGVVVPASTTIDNQPFSGAGGTPFEGSIKPLCDTKLVRVSDKRSIAPTFNMFTDVPIPGRFWGLIVDDLNFSSNPKSLTYGEKAGVPFAPVGIYDYTNRLVTTVESDYNGLFDVLLPSTNRISCPTPSGVCANLYRFVGNDPGTPGHLNLNYNPQFRTIAAEFEAIPGLLVPADLAPTQVGVTIQLPGSQFSAPVACTLDSATPQLFSVNQPYADMRGGAQKVVIHGRGFGAAQGAGYVSLNGSALPIDTWSETQITAKLPVGTPVGSQQLLVTANNGQSTVNGITFHVLGDGPLPAYPGTSVLDNFNRASLANLGSDWGGAGLASAIYRILNNDVEARRLGDAWWVGAGSPFGANQEAYYTFVRPSTTSTDQGLILKLSGSILSPNYIEVGFNATNNTIRIRTRTPSQGIVNHGGLITATFAAGDRFGARALSDGTVIVYKNNAQIGSTNVTTTGAPFWPAALAQAGGQIGVRFGNSVTNSLEFDDFGGGSLTPTSYFLPTVFEVGAGHTYATIQSALDAASSVANALVVVYPGTPDLLNPRNNPRGAYYENIIMYSPVKLQGVGPGGLYADGTTEPGSIIDGGGFAGDTDLATAWRTKVAGLTWDGNQNVNEGETIYVLAHNGQFTPAYKASIDGFNLTGGDQTGFPTNINQVGGGNTGLPAAVVTQGGAIFANAYAQNLQITNNVVQSNGGGYGTIRIGTPEIPAPNNSNHNENLLISHNRVIANAGTNLAGGIGIFSGADNYEVAYNDVCGNFSAEYGGGLSVYGYSPNGKIHDNRIYFNRSYDEAGGVMIAGELPADVNALSPGSGPQDIYNNLIQANMGNDDGGGIRFLMAGNFPMNVYNNIISNNVSTHEGGGISLNDSPDVRVYNNTIIKNITTATALTSNGFPAPAGLSTSLNSVMLQATLPLGSTPFSNPLLFNNIFWDNRAGTRAGNTVTGIGIPGDVSDINYWDMGVADGGAAVVSPTNSIMQVTTGTISSPTNKVGQDPLVISAYDTSVAFTPWRTNPNFVDAIMVAAELPANLMGNYHVPAASPALNMGASLKGAVAAPALDYDHQARPGAGGFDAGADEADGAAPVVAFPTTPVLDTFNRPNSTNLTANWNTPTTGYQILSNSVSVQTGALPIWWAASSFDANQEVFFTFGKVANVATQALILKFKGTTTPVGGADASFIGVAYNNLDHSITVRTKSPTQGWQTRLIISTVTFVAGDTFGARALRDGTVTVYKNGVQIASTNVSSGALPWDAALNQGGGRIGVWFQGTSAANDAKFDNFGGGNLP